MKRAPAFATAALIVLGALPATASADTVTTGPGYAYTPSTLTVSVGSAVTFSSPLGSPFTGNHDIVFEDGSFSYPESGATFMAWQTTRVFDHAGTFPFYCSVHGGPGGVGMSGRIIIQGAGGGGAGPGQTGGKADRPQVGSLSVRFTRRHALRIAFDSSDAGVASVTVSRILAGRGRSRRPVSVARISKSVDRGHNSILLKRDRRGRRLHPGTYLASVFVRSKSGVSATERARSTRRRGESNDGGSR